MLYGLAGASGTGKSTLARSVAEAMDLALVETSITAMGRSAGFDPVGQLTLTERFDLQEALLHQFTAMVQSIKGPAILDRTPMDLCMYLMAEIAMHAGQGLDAARLAWAAGYVKRCTDLTDRYFDHVFITPPGLPYETAATRPPADPAYQLHCHLILMGVVSEMDGHIDYDVLRTTDHAARVDFVSDVIINRLDAHEADRKSSLHLH
ncbi:AAA family ATPase [Paracoccus litorisediminis]|uniref:AAA family ATPase n=1 Tax=Paracoccus litorisediminis TaxID=2006130 RepID=A0A844HU70_9RHOB|nr:AAA family ATPase [Paracoccus litorisediminis]MTH61121.1 AAA family ATPase [Paracoccus litorisediminis]